MSSMDFECWKHLHEHGASLAGSSAAEAAKSGSLPRLRYIHDNGVVVNKQALTAAVSHGHMDCVAFIHEELNVPVNADHGAAAARRGDLACLKYLFEHGCPTSNKISAGAAHSGDVECLKYVHERGCAMTKLTMESAKSFDCIKYMHEKKVKWDVDSCHWAMSGNHLDCLHYFHDRGMRWQHVQSSACTESGESLRFLCEHGVKVSQESVARSIIPRDRVNCLKIAVEFGYQPTAKDCAACVSERATSMQCLQYLHEIHCPWDATVCTEAAATGQQSTLEYLLDSGCPCGADTFEAALLGFVQPIHLLINGTDNSHLLLDGRCPYDTCTTVAVVACLHILDYKRHRSSPSYEHPTTTTTSAEVRRHMFSFKSALEHGCQLREGMVTHVLQNPRLVDRLPMVQYLHERGCPWDSRVCTIAAAMGSLNLLKYAHERGCELTSEACTRAIVGPCFYIGNQVPPCLLYLREHDFPWDVTVSRAAAASDNLSVMTYVHQQGCPCDETTTAAASTENCSVVCLQYLHEHGVPWDATASIAAATAGNLKCLQYLLANGCPCDATTCAAAAGHYKSVCLPLLHENGVPWDEGTCTAAVRTGCIDNLKYAHENGCPWNHHTYQAATSDYYRRCILEYLNLHGCPRTAEETATQHAQKNATVEAEVVEVAE